ncbi:MAG: hypothetical protein ABIT01_16730, partial [Thermoanaerobaculia bacterium]
AFGTLTPGAEAARVRVVRHGRRGRVVVHTGFPIHRTLPGVWVRQPAVAIRVAPRVYVAPVAFAATVVAVRPVREAIAWEATESLDRKEDWTEFNLNVDQRGRALLLDIDDGRAQVNFAEVVFENGDTQVVDFEEKAMKSGLYQLLDFKDGRKVDHVRMVARATSDDVDISVRMVK